MADSPYLTQDRFAQSLGVTECSGDFQRMRCALNLAPQHYNGLGGVHGAVIFALADIAFAAACNAGEGTYVGMQAEVKYLKPVQGQTLSAEAVLLDSSKKMAFYDVAVRDAEGRQVALFRSTAYRLA